MAQQFGSKKKPARRAANATPEQLDPSVNWLPHEPAGAAFAAPRSWAKPAASGSSHLHHRLFSHSNHTRPQQPPSTLSLREEMSSETIYIYIPAHPNNLNPTSCRTRQRLHEAVRTLTRSLCDLCALSFARSTSRASFFSWYRRSDSVICMGTSQHASIRNSCSQCFGMGAAHWQVVGGVGGR
jgi:hypothetical protein